jgi:hypothetical protein
MTYETAAVAKDCACREAMQSIGAKIEVAGLEESVVQDKGRGRSEKERAREVDKGVANSGFVNASVEQGRTAHTKEREEKRNTVNSTKTSCC